MMKAFRRLDASGVLMALAWALPAWAASPLSLTNGLYVNPDSSPAVWARNNTMLRA